MKINFQNIHFTLEDEDRDYAAEKIGHLEKYFKNIISADVIFTCDHEDASGNVYKGKVTLKIPGKDLFAEDEGRDIKFIIDGIEPMLKHQIERIKEKNNPKKIYRMKRRLKEFFGDNNVQMFYH